MFLPIAVQNLSTIREHLYTPYLTFVSLLRGSPLYIFFSFDEFRGSSHQGARMHSAANPTIQACTSCCTYAFICDLSRSGIDDISSRILFSFFFFFFPFIALNTPTRFFFSHCTLHRLYSRFPPIFVPAVVRGTSLDVTFSKRRDRTVSCWLISLYGGSV